MRIAKERAKAVELAVARIRAIEREMGVTCEALDAIRGELVQLAGQRRLFPESEFPPEGSDGGDRIHCLSIDPDQRFALYLDRCDSFVETPPHNHTTWAVVVGLRGAEHNTFFEPENDGPSTNGHSDSRRGPLRKIREFTVRPGTGICLMPDDFHAIRIDGGRVNMNLHMYGHGFEAMPKRVMFNAETNSYDLFRPSD